MMTRTSFLKTLPAVVIPKLPRSLQDIKVRQPYRWLLQLNYGEPGLHYEVSNAKYRPGWEIGFHCEARDKHLNRFLLEGFRRHLFEIKTELGESVEAEMWDRGWTKIYEILPEAELTPEYQAEVGVRLAEFIICLHPIYVQLRNDVARVHR